MGGVSIHLSPWRVLCWAPLLLVAGATPVSAQPLGLLPPIVFESGAVAIDPDQVQRALVEALAARPGVQLVVGETALLARAEPAAAPLDPRLAQAREALARGEEQYLSFRFEPAATTLADAADGYSALIGTLTSDQLQQLYRALLLQGLCWIEAKKKDKARQAFARLIVIRPDFEPDPSQVSPGARELFRQALSEVRGAGVATLEVRSEPAGAQVVLDGLPRGSTPIAISSLPAGHHHVRLSRAGFQPFDRELELRPPGQTLSDAALEPLPVTSALQRAIAAARASAAPDLASADLQLVREQTRLQSLILVGLARLTPARSGRDLLVTIVRFGDGERSAVALATSASELATDCRAVAAKVIERSWPAATWPADSASLPVDFSASLLGVGSRASASPAAANDESSLLGSWWLWAGVGAAVLVGAGAAAAGSWWYLSSNQPPAARERTRFVLEF